LLADLLTGFTRTNEVAPGEFNDNGQDPPPNIHFDALCPGTSQLKTIAVRNDAGIPVNFKWTVHNHKGINTREASSAEETFLFTPSSGILPPRSTTTFEIEFAPPATGNFDALTTLELLDIPKDPAVEAAEKSRQQQLAAEAERMVAYAATLGEYVPEREDAGADENKLTQAISSPEPATDKLANFDSLPVLRRNLVCCSLALQGCGNAVSVLAEPAVLAIPRELVPGIESEKSCIVLANEGDADVSYHFSRCVTLHSTPPGATVSSAPFTPTRKLKPVAASTTLGVGCSISPRIGIIPAHGSVEVYVTFTADVPGAYEVGLEGRLYHGSDYGEAADGFMSASSFSGAGSAMTPSTARSEPSSPTGSITFRSAGSPRTPVAASQDVLGTPRAKSSPTGVVASEAWAQQLPASPRGSHHGMPLFQRRAGEIQLRVKATVACPSLQFITVSKASFKTCTY
jgi:hypothetical protein